MIFVTSLTQNPHLAMIDFPNANNLYLYLIYMILWPNPILISSESPQINNKDAPNHYMPYSTPLSFQDHPQSIDPPLSHSLIDIILKPFLFLILTTKLFWCVIK
jgi:hypothetical protein